jgi:hypothetical protein
MHFWTISCHYRLNFFWDDRITQGAIAGLERLSLLPVQRSVGARNGLGRAVADHLAIEASWRCLSVPPIESRPHPCGVGHPAHGPPIAVSETV